TRGCCCFNRPRSKLRQKEKVGRCHHATAKPAPGEEERVRPWVQESGSVHHVRRMRELTVSHENMKRVVVAIGSCSVHSIARRRRDLSKVHRFVGAKRYSRSSRRLN